MTAAMQAAAGAMSKYVNLANHTVADVVLDPANASAEYRLTAGGPVEWQNSGTSWAAFAGESCGGGAGYECRASIVSGTVSSGSTGTWLALTSTRAWTKTQSVVGTGSVTLTIEVRSAASLVVLGTATITLTATVTA